MEPKPNHSWMVALALIGTLLCGGASGYLIARTYDQNADREISWPGREVSFADLQSAGYLRYRCADATAGNGGYGDCGGDPLRAELKTEAHGGWLRYSLSLTASVSSEAPKMKTTAFNEAARVPVADEPWAPPATDEVGALSNCDAIIEFRDRHEMLLAQTAPRRVVLVAAAPSGGWSVPGALTLDGKVEIVAGTALQVRDWGLRLDCR